MTDRQKPGRIPMPDHIAEAMAKIGKTKTIKRREAHKEVARVIKALKKQKVTQEEVCRLVERNSGKTLTSHHLRNVIKGGYDETALYILGCLGYEIGDTVLIEFKG